MLHHIIYLGVCFWNQSWLISIIFCTLFFPSTSLHSFSSISFSSMVSELEKNPSGSIILSHASANLFGKDHGKDQSHILLSLAKVLWWKAWNAPHLKRIISLGGRRCSLCFFVATNWWFMLMATLTSLHHQLPLNQIKWFWDGLSLLEFVNFSASVDTHHFRRVLDLLHDLFASATEFVKGCTHHGGVSHQDLCFEGCTSCG